MTRAWCITGSRDGHPHLRRTLAAMRLHEYPSLFVCGDAAGVDTEVFDWASKHIDGSRICQHFVDDDLGSPEKYHDRNRRMIARCKPNDRLLAFPNGESRGTWNTVKLGAQAGMECRVFFADGGRLLGTGDIMVRVAEWHLHRRNRGEW